MVIVLVHHVQKLSVEKIQLYKYIVQEIQKFLDNVVINIIALRVGKNIIRNNSLFTFFLFHLDSKQCHHDKKIYNENETWTIDQCTTCTCRSGVVDCAMVQCPTYTHCGYMYKPENECCPRCGGKILSLN